MSNIVIPDGGTIGSTSDTDAISISSSGAVTLSSDFVPATPLSHRNLIINGDFRVNQAGNKTGKTAQEKQFAGDHTHGARSVVQHSENREMSRSHVALHSEPRS